MGKFKTNRKNRALFIQYYTSLLMNLGEEERDASMDSFFPSINTMQVYIIIMQNQIAFLSPDPLYWQKKLIST